MSMREQTAVILGIDNITDDRLEEFLQKNKVNFDDLTSGDVVDDYIFTVGVDESLIGKHIILEDCDGMVAIGYLIGYSDDSYKEEHQVKFRDLNLIDRSLQGKLASDFNTSKSTRILIKNIWV